MHPTASRRPAPLRRFAGAKTDPGDSYKLADYLRTDGHRLRRLQPLDPGLRELQALVQLREDHVRARTAASSQLGALLDAYWPGPKAMFCKLASDIALAFLTDYPTPQAAARLGQARLAGFCRAMPTGAASHPPNSWPGCGQHRSHPAGWRLRCSPS